VGSQLASIPQVSLLAIVWLYIDTKDTAQIASLSTGIFWLVIPSLVFFIVLPLLLKRSLNFWLSLIISSVLTIIAYFIMLYLLKKSGIKL
jgi:predicted permease